MPSVEGFFNKQHETLRRIETSIVKARTDLEAARNETTASLKTKREKAASNRKSFEKDMSDSWSKMKAGMATKREETDARVEEWKQKREFNKLEKRAQNLEDYADSAMTVLDLAQEEATAATLEAIEARRQVEEAKAVGARA